MDRLSLFEWLERCFALIPDGTIDEVNALHDLWLSKDQTYLSDTSWTSPLATVAASSAADCARYCLRICREFGADVPHFEDLTAHFIALPNYFYYSERVSIRIDGPWSVVNELNEAELEMLRTQLFDKKDVSSNTLGSQMQPKTVGHLLMTASNIDGVIRPADPTLLQSRVLDTVGRFRDKEILLDAQLTGFIHRDGMSAMALPISVKVL